MVVKQVIEPILDPVLLADSYGYRPNKSALDAVGVTRKRCWKYDWVLEFDIKGLFDNIDHEFLLRAIRKHVTCKWALLYIERWLKAPMIQEDGTIMERRRGTPQGGVLTPLTQKVISSLNEQLRDGEPGTLCLIFALKGNTFMALDAFDQSGKSSAAERRSWSAPASSCPSRSRATVGTRVRFVGASSISLPGRGLPAQSSNRSSRSHGTDHAEASAAYSGTSPEVRETQRTNHWSNRNRRVECVSTHSQKAWLSRVPKAAHFKSKFPIRLIACSSRNWRRLTTFWCHVASAPSACA
jgi:Reverse transcriptase (RNA-dependent DNA polymerase)